jgi:hypothetical protein
MKFLSLLDAVLLIALLGAGLNAQPARAADYKIRWLDLSSVPHNSPVPSGTAFTLPGYNGVVTVSYTSTSPEWNNDTYLPMQNGIVTSPAGVYGWASVDYLASVNKTANSIDYMLTFTFTGPGPLPPAGQLVLGSIGLGGHLADGPTTATVHQNGTFLGDWNLGDGFGPTICTPGASMFTLTNSLIDPVPGYFNTDFGLTRIDDLFAGSLTISVHQVGGDGIGFTIGLPEPDPCATNCLAIYNPDDIVVTTCSNSLPVFYSVNVSDTCCNNCVELVSDPPSGYNFPLGTTTVTSTATDTLGNSIDCSFTITVLQNTNPPAITYCPTSILVCTNSDGCGPMPDATSQVQATSSAGGTVVVSQDISPGTILCSDTVVTFTVSDGCGDATNCTVPCYLVNCSSNCLQVQCPSNIVVVSCTNVPVLFQPTVTDCCSNWTVVCSPTNGSYFSPGTTNTVYCLASDPCGNSNNCEFTVTVLQPTSLFLCPSNIVVDCTNDSGRVVNYPTQAVAAIQYNPPSGSTFLIGTTPVSCIATDACGNVSTCIFDVIVRGHGNALGHWVKSNCGNGPLTQGNAIAVDQNGNTFVGGVFSGTTNFCGVILSSGGSDGFVAKYDTFGTLLWVRQITGPGNEDVLGVAVDSQGNSYVVGNFNGAYVVFPDPAHQLSLENPSAGGSDVFLAKYDPNGGVLWFATAGGPSVDNGEGVAVDTNDNCYITGVFSGTANFGTTLLTSSSYDCFIAKWNSAGTFQWATNSSGTSGHGVDARSVAIDSLHGKAFITGEFSSDARFGSATLGPSGRFGSAFVAELNLGNNSPAWGWASQVTCATNCGSQDGRAIGVDNAGYCYFTAYFNGEASIGGSIPPVNNTYPYSLNDYLIGKFDGDGNPLNLIKGLVQGDGEPRGLVVDRNSGDVYVTGFRHGFDSNADGGQDATLFKYDSNLSLKWTQDGSGTFPKVNTGRGVALDSAGCVYVTGSYTDNSLVFTNFVDGVHIFSAPSGTTKLFVAKYCPSCSTNCVTATIVSSLQNAWVSAGPSLANPISFTVTASGSTPLLFSWYRNNGYLAAPSGTGYTITISPDGLSCTLKLTGVPSIGTGSTYTVYVSNFHCCDCGPASSHASIYYWVNPVGGGFNPVSRYQLGVAAGTGNVFRVEYRDDLNPGTPWQFLTNLIGAGTNTIIFDPNPNPVMRFYQIPLEPDP